LSGSGDLTGILGITIGVYVVAMYVLAWSVQGRVNDTEDFLVAGRRLGLPFAWATLLATWFGAGTLLTATDEVRRGGLQRAALDPLGAGICLILAGLFFAVPLWRMGLLTFSDFFERRFGSRAEIVSALIMVPAYFGWVAAQFVALAGMLELIFGLEMRLGIPIVAVVAMGYTLMGGMWAVTVTDGVQVGLLLLGLVVLAFYTFADLGQGSVVAGLERLLRETPPEMLQPFPRDSIEAFVGWAAVVAVGALGNIPGQDLLQRVFASRSEVVARRACVLAGLSYLGFGLFPIALGLAGRLLFSDSLDRAVLPALMQVFLHPFPAIVFTVALISAVLSTIDSAILSPASVLSQNVLPRLVGDRLALTPLQWNRWAVVMVTAASLGVAFMGESAYSLLEDAYELPLVSLFVPLTLGLFRRRGRERAALASMIAGAALWLVHYALGWEAFLAPWLGEHVPVSLAGVATSLLAWRLAEIGDPPPAGSERAPFLQP